MALAQQDLVISDLDCADLLRGEAVVGDGDDEEEDGENQSAGGRNGESEEEEEEEARSTGDDDSEGSSKAPGAKKKKKPVKKATHSVGAGKKKAARGATAGSEGVHWEGERKKKKNKAQPKPKGIETEESKVSLAPRSTFQHSTSRRVLLTCSVLLQAERLRQAIGVGRNASRAVQRKQPEDDGEEEEDESE